MISVDRKRIKAIRNDLTRTLKTRGGIYWLVKEEVEFLLGLVEKHYPQRRFTRYRKG